MLKLTERERDYLSLVAQGCSNKEIADILIVSKCTVKKTLENIFEKLGARGRTHATVIAIKYRILKVEELL